MANINMGLRKTKKKWTGREWLQGINKWKKPEKTDQTFEELYGIKWYQNLTERERYLETFGIDINKEAKVLGITLKKYDITPIGNGIVLVFKDATGVRYYIRENREYRTYRDKKILGI